VRMVLVADADTAKLTAAIGESAAPLRNAADSLAKAGVNAVLAIGDVAQQGLVWNVTTTVTNTALVQYTLQAALGEDMRIQPRIKYVRRGDRPYPITDRLLPAGVNADLTDFLGGAAFDFDSLNPPQSVEAIKLRLDNMSFQPEYVDQPKRDFRVIGITPVEGQKDEAGNPLYSRVAIVAVDPDLRHGDNPQAWLTDFAQKEGNLIDGAFSIEQTLRKVMQFKPQIAARSQAQAVVALLLSWAMIIGYVWIRFGRPVYGIAGVIALVHDVLVALALVGISGLIGGANHPIGGALLIDEFKINMPIVAALLTIIGFSINDTIVIFDRVRELRGRLGIVTPQIINDAVNECMSRTILTTFTVLVVIFIAYVWGGSSIRGFNYCMLAGCISGTYSTVVIAAPLLLIRADKTAAARG
jgi:SecD/SecF fusion protein